MSTLEESFKSMQQTIFKTNQQLIEACAHMDKIMTHLSQHVSTPSPDQVQEFHQLSQVDFNSNHEDTQPILEETFENFMQFSQRMLSDNVQLLAHLDMLTSELASGQENDSFFTQSVLEQTSSI